MSDKPLAERLQVKAGRTLAVVDAPAGVDVVGDGSLSDADVVLAFAADGAALEMVLARLLTGTKPAAILWTAYPKLTSPLARDLSREIVRDRAQAHGLDTVSQIAVDADWSALRLKRIR